MSDDNAERLRGFLEAWTRNGAWTADAPQPEEDELAVLHPDIVFEDTTLDHAGRTYRGYGGILRATEQWVEPFEWMLVELEDVVEIGQHLVSIHRWQGKARDTAVEFDVPLAYLWTFRDGQVVHCRSYLNPEEALTAAREGEHRS